MILFIILVNNVDKLGSLGVLCFMVLFKINDNNNTVFSFVSKHATLCGATRR